MSGRVDKSLAATGVDKILSSVGNFAVGNLREEAKPV